jgi:hypothetical protein
VEELPEYIKYRHVDLSSPDPIKGDLPIDSPHIADEMIDDLADEVAPLLEDDVVLHLRDLHYQKKLDEKVSLNELLKLGKFSDRGGEGPDDVDDDEPVAAPRPILRPPGIDETNILDYKRVPRPRIRFNLKVFQPTE